MRKWLQYSGVRVGARQTEDQLTVAVQKATTGMMDSMKAKGLFKEGFVYKGNVRDLTQLEQEYLKLGFNEMDSAKPRNSPQELAAFAGVLSVVDLQLEHLELAAHKSESVQEVTAALSAAIALKQMKEIFQNPPAVKDWKEAKIVIDLARDALDMNRKVKEVHVNTRVSIDEDILRFTPGKQKSKQSVTLDADIANQEI